MKKVISLLLAVLMMFSVCTVAFAETSAEGEGQTTTEAVPDDGTGDTETPAEGEEETPDLSDVQWILDLPFWTVKAGSKVAKVAAKLVIVYLKVAKIFGLVEKDAMDYVIEFILNALENQETPEETTTVAPAEETTAPVAA